VAIPPIAMTLAVAKQSIATVFVRSNYILWQWLLA